MLRRSYLKSIFAIALFLIAIPVVFAQNAPVSGSVELDTNGTKTPVAGALIEVYRMDISAGFPSAKTDKGGRFAFAGMPAGAQFVFSVSAPGCAPNYLANVKAGQEKLLITLKPGDGGKFTEAQVRDALKGKVTQGTGTGTGPAKEMSADDKKAQAEYLAKKKEVDDKNAKATKANEIVNRTLKEGNDAFNAKNFEVAIAKYTEGIDADPEFAGSAPVLLNNRGAALRAFGTDTYNKGVKLPDPTERNAAKAAAKKDFADAADSYMRSWNLLSKASPADVGDPKTLEANKISALQGLRDAARLSVQIEQVDEKVLEVAKVMLPEYINMETDAAKKAEASLIMADLYRVSGDFENAIAGYRKVLDGSPDNVDALAGAALCLINVGYISSDKTKFQEGANYLQKFVSLAPDSHKFKADAVDLIEKLKKEQNVAPQKVTTTPKKKP